MCRHEVRRLTGTDSALGQSYGQVRFANAGWRQQNDIRSFMDEAQCSEFPDLPFIDGRLKAEVKLIESLDIRQVCQL
jgi:hypothetical protein